MNKTRLVTAIGAVAGASFAASAMAADQTANPFQADDLEAGSIVQIGDDHKDKDKDKDKDKEGSCGEGSCGEGDEGGDEEGSCGEGSCGEGSCGAA